MSTGGYDRKSGVSSYYSGRRSEDVLNQDFPSPTRGQYQQVDRQADHLQHDSASSFYNPNGPSRASVEQFSRQPTAGYNGASYYDTGRTEPVKGGYDEESPFQDEPFDIYADFNNAGPRYSKATFVPDNGSAEVLVLSEGRR